MIARTRQEERPPSSKDLGRSMSAYSDSLQESSRYTERYSESEDSEGGHGKPRSRRHKPNTEDDDLSQPWQKDGESTADFIQRYKSESGIVKGAPECMKISGFVHGITNPKLIKRFRKKIPKTIDEMMQEGSHKQNFKKGGGFRSHHKQEKRPDRFSLLTKTPKEILALEKEKFKTPPPMTTPVEKRNANKFCEFHGEVGYNTDECNHLRKQIEDMLKAGKLSHLIKELKQSSGKDLQKKKGETFGKEKPQEILMIQSW
ncbi:hypothetical protein Tco_1327782 [Tanacetum coccineum]